jgi:tRNA dimethylallyltransferase
LKSNNTYFDIKDMKKLLVICGPTATGKTSLALHLAKELNGELVSADSRQVYKGMDIGTGKDIPENLKSQISNLKSGNNYVSFYEINGVRLWGYDLVNPEDEFSVSHYTTIAHAIIKDILLRGKLPILVGGTGFYIKSVVDGIASMIIPQDIQLRKELSENSAKDLFDILFDIDKPKALSLNNSDVGNPRRLIRAIEIAHWNKAKGQQDKHKRKTENYDTLFIGLNGARAVLYDRVETRVHARINNGFEREVLRLIESGVKWTDQSMQSLGYRQWKDYLNGICTKEESILEWIHQEQLYIKRQLTWFLKNKNITWFDVSDTHINTKVEQIVKTWHNIPSKG